MDVVSERTLTQKQWKVWSMYILFSSKSEKVTTIFSLYRQFEYKKLRTLVNQGNPFQRFDSMLLLMQLKFNRTRTLTIVCIVYSISSQPLNSVGLSNFYQRQPHPQRFFQKVWTEAVGKWDIHFILPPWNRYFAIYRMAVQFILDLTCQNQEFDL